MTYLMLAMVLVWGALEVADVVVEEMVRHPIAATLAVVSVLAVAIITDPRRK